MHFLITKIKASFFKSFVFFGLFLLRKNSLMFFIKTKIYLKFFDGHEKKFNKFNNGYKFINYVIEFFEEALITYPKDKSLIKGYMHISILFGRLPDFIQFLLDNKLVENGSGKLIDELAEQIVFGNFLHFYARYFRKISVSLGVEISNDLSNKILIYLSKSDQYIERSLEVLYWLKSVDADNYDFFYKEILNHTNICPPDNKKKYAINFFSKATLPYLTYTRSAAYQMPVTFTRDLYPLINEVELLGDPVVDFNFLPLNPWVSLLFSCSKKPYYSAISLFEKLCFKVWPRLDYVAPHVKSGAWLKSKNKIRIGFNVLDSMPMMSGLLINLDKSVFETYFLCPNMRSGGEQARLWVERADNVIEYSSSNTFDAIKTISDQQLDIIISGPSVPQVFFPMMARLAPLQMILLEPNWMDGTKNLDYYISWKEAEPKDPKNLYKSNVAFLKTPPYWIDRPPQLDVAYKKPELQKIRKRLLNVSSKRRVYLCANTPPKIHPEMDDVFFGILDEDRLATLVFLRSEYPAVDIIKDRLKARLGKYYSRVIFLPTLSRDDAHLLVRSVDCCLDSFPICGMSSSFDASILGVPLVTFPHKNSFGSWTAAIYKYIGVKGLIAKTKREYINIAIKLASDKNWRDEISKEIKAKSSVFVENKLAANEFQNFIIKAWGIKKNQSELGL